MANIEKSNLTKELLEKAMACKTPDELVKLAKADGYEITRDEAEVYMAATAISDLEEDDLKKVAGGWRPDFTKGDSREDMEPGKMPEAFLRGEITGGEDF